MFGASPGELAMVAVLVVVVLLAQVAPRIGEAIGSRWEGRDPPQPPDPSG